MEPKIPVRKIRLMSAINQFDSIYDSNKPILYVMNELICLENGLFQIATVASDKIKRGHRPVSESNGMSKFTTTITNTIGIKKFSKTAETETKSRELALEDAFRVLLGLSRLISTFREINSADKLDYQITDQLRQREMLDSMIQIIVKKKELPSSDYFVMIIVKDCGTFRKAASSRDAAYRLACTKLVKHLKQLVSVKK